jgi:hypothetical protein
MNAHRTWHVLDHGCDVQDTRISRKQLVSSVGLLTKTSIAMVRPGSMPCSGHLSSAFASYRI